MLGHRRRCRRWPSEDEERVVLSAPIAKKPHGERVVGAYTTSSGGSERSVWVMYGYHLELAYRIPHRYSTGLRRGRRSAAAVRFCEQYSCVLTIVYTKSVPSANVSQYHYCMITADHTAFCDRCGTSPSRRLRAKAYRHLVCRVLTSTPLHCTGAQAHRSSGPHHARSIFHHDRFES